jgi:hypothetical protein
MTVAQRIEMLPPLIRRVRGQAWMAAVCLAALGMLEAVALANLVMKWSLDRVVDPNRSDALPSEMLLLLALPSGIALVLGLVGVYALHRWATLAGLNAELSTLQTLTEANET